MASGVGHLDVVMRMLLEKESNAPRSEKFPHSHPGPAGMTIRTCTVHAQENDGVNTNRASPAPHSMSLKILRKELLAHIKVIHCAIGATLIGFSLLDLVKSCYAIDEK